MNRRNLAAHVALALTFVMVAAVAGHLSRLGTGKKEAVTGVLVGVGEGGAAPRAVSAEEAGEPEVLVRFRAGVPRERVEEIAMSFGDRVEDEIESVENLYAVDDLEGETAALVAGEYGALPEVEYVEENARIDLSPLEGRELGRGIEDAEAGGPNDPLLGEQWGLINRGQRSGKDKADISALQAWAKTHGSERVVVAVLDSGVDYTHPDLVNNLWLRPDDLDPYYDDETGEVEDYRGFSAVSPERDPMDENGHGTHCSGIAGAEGDNGIGITGVNWKVEIMPLKFMGKGGYGSTKDAIEAINYVIKRKRDGVNVRVISASWGSRQKSRALEEVIRRAGDEGILFVAAAGNNSENADRFPHYPSGYQLPNVLAVAALDRRDELARFSNYGAKSVHVAAPGAEILSTWLGDSYREASGTSMATPMVAGVAALVLSCEPNLSVAELKERLMSTSDSIATLQGKVVSGGRVNAARAVGAVR
ncbi:MAG TPA: S8 family serine peptidase [Pyrinomonadaceae bacterium]|nr:S8 family serine peptidase [Pyrinomonadaceae bacterium]